MSKSQTYVWKHARAALASRTRGQALAKPAPASCSQCHARRAGPWDAGCIDNETKPRGLCGFLGVMHTDARSCGAVSQRCPQLQFSVAETLSRLRGSELERGRDWSEAKWHGLSPHVRTQAAAAPRSLRRMPHRCHVPHMPHRCHMPRMPHRCHMLHMPHRCHVPHMPHRCHMPQWCPRRMPRRCFRQRVTLRKRRTLSILLPSSPTFCAPELPLLHRASPQGTVPVSRGSIMRVGAGV